MGGHIFQIPRTILRYSCRRGSPAAGRCTKNVSAYDCRRPDAPKARLACSGRTGVPGYALNPLLQELRRGRNRRPHKLRGKAVIDSVTDRERGNSVLILFSDTGGGHRAAAKALEQALTQLDPKVKIAKLDPLIFVMSSLIIKGAASIAHMLNCVRNWLGPIPWSGPR